MRKLFPLLLMMLFTRDYSFSSLSKKYSCENCKGNQPLIANAGTDQTIILLKDSIMPDGSASADPDGIIPSHK
ncbi:MAG: hypothetical protein ABIN97_10375 [Ginsengibacter sp.]